MRACLMLFVLACISPAAAAAPEPGGAVLVTGASTGIGRNIAESLARQGHFVFAGARSDEDIAALSAIDNIRGIRLDVTRPEDIEAAVKTVSESGKSLAGLVNNAGVIALGPLTEAPEEDLRFTFDVNVYGPFRMTQAFADLLIESKGRVVTIGSISGILSGPFAGSYSMSKHAVEAYTDSLAVELAPFGVHVSVVEPGNYRSAIAETMQQRMRAQGLELENSRYKARWAALLEADMSRTEFKEPDEVAAAVTEALFSENPRRRYLVVPNEGEAEMTIRQVLRELAQLNHGQPYEFSREALIAMLDEALETESAK